MLYTCVRILLVALLVGGLVGPATAATAWDEDVDGDLSTDPGAPTPVSLSFSSNIISGTVTAPDDTRDYITFTIDPGRALVALWQLEYEDVATGGDGNTGYHAIIDGPTSLIPSGSTAGDFLGGHHMVPPSPRDVLPDLADALSNGSGFSIPLGPGTYSYHVQQTSSILTGYTLDFVMVPEPSSLLLALLGLAACGIMVRRC